MTTNKIGKILTGVCILFIITGCLIWNRNSGGNNVQTSSISKKGTYIMDINQDAWSDEVILGIAEPLEITWGTIADNVPFYVIINGGKEEGGIEYYTPPRKNLDEIGWKSPFFSGTIIKVRFGLAKCSLKSAKLVYTIR